MKVREIPCSWIIEAEHRLDCGPFTRGGIEAKRLIEGGSFPRDRLAQLTLGGLDGIYHVGMDKLRWVEDPDYGVPFLRSADILKSDLSHQPMIHREQVAGNPLFTCPAGSTLITRSGTIGRMVYCRSEMSEMAISQDVLKVVPDTRRIRSGYLYAFLTSKYGVPIVVSGTFGSIIVHIEAENVADLPVPRLGQQLEQEVHELVHGAAAKRGEASDLMKTAAQLLASELSLEELQPPRRHERPLVSLISSSEARTRMDGFYYCSLNEEARRAFDEAKGELRALRDVAEVFIPGIFKRRYAEDQRFGYPYITGGDVFTLAPSSEKHLMKRVAEDYGLVLKRGMIVIQEAGQLGGLIGRSVPVGSYLDGFACTNNMVRVTPDSSDDFGYLFAVLSSPYGVRLISREAAGSSIPHIELSRVAGLMIPWADPPTRRMIGQPVVRAQELRDGACDEEAEARTIVERAIEQAA